LKTRTAVRIAAITVSFAAGAAVPWIPAYGATVPSVNWAQASCRAEHMYAARPTGAHLITLVIDSTHLGRSYLRADIGQLYADASSPSAASAKYVSDDEQYIYEDCSSGSGL
jgi:hypothetical protein